MKNNLILTTILLASISLPSMAIIAPEEASSEEAIINRGYSEQMARLITIKSAQAAGLVPEAAEEPDYRKNFNWVRKFFIYSDPALEKDDFLRHNIHAVPSVNDL